MPNPFADPGLPTGSTPAYKQPRSMQSGDNLTQDTAVATLLNKRPDVRARLTALQNISAHLTGRWQGALQSLAEARTGCDDAKQALDVARADAVRPGADLQDVVTHAEARVQATKAALNAADAEAYKASQASAVTRDALNPAMKLLNGAATERRPVTFIKGATWKGRADEAVTAQRAVIERLLDERRAVAAARWPREVVEAELLSQLDAMAKPPVVSVGRSAVARTSAYLRMPQEGVRAAPLADTEVPTVTDAAGLFAWAHRDLIAQHISDELDVKYPKGRLALHHCAVWPQRAHELQHRRVTHRLAALRAGEHQRVGLARCR